MSHLNFCNPIKVDMSGNTDWPQASGFQKTRQIAQFLAFLTNFCHYVNVVHFARNVEWYFLLWFPNTVQR